MRTSGHYTCLPRGNLEYRYGTLSNAVLCSFSIHTWHVFKENRNYFLSHRKPYLPEIVFQEVQYLITSWCSTNMRHMNLYFVCIFALEHLCRYSNFSRVGKIRVPNVGRGSLLLHKVSIGLVCCCIFVL